MWRSHPWRSHPWRSRLVSVVLVLGQVPPVIYNEGRLSVPHIRSLSLSNGLGHKVILSDPLCRYVVARDYFAGYNVCIQICWQRAPVHHNPRVPIVRNQVQCVTDAGRSFYNVRLREVPGSKCHDRVLARDHGESNIHLLCCVGRGHVAVDLEGGTGHFLVRHSIYHTHPDHWRAAERIVHVGINGFPLVAHTIASSRHLLLPAHPETRLRSAESVVDRQHSSDPPNVSSRRPRHRFTQDRGVHAIAEINVQINLPIKQLPFFALTVWGICVHVHLIVTRQKKVKRHRFRAIEHLSCLLVHFAMGCVVSVEGDRRHVVPSDDSLDVRLVPPRIRILTCVPCGHAARKPVRPCQPRTIQLDCATRDHVNVEVRRRVSPPQDRARLSIRDRHEEEDQNGGTDRVAPHDCSLRARREAFSPHGHAPRALRDEDPLRGKTELGAEKGPGLPRDRHLDTA
eukprot:1623618-Rhodomonas_salina.1